MKELYYYFKIIRPLNVFISCVAVIFSATILNSLHKFSTLVLTTLVVMLFTSAANIINDVMDLQIDKINRPLRPIPSGKVKQNIALQFSFYLFLIGSILCVQLPNTAIFIGVLISMPIMIIYSTHLKGKPLIGNIAVSLVIGLSFLFCGAAFGNIYSLWVPCILAFGLTLVRELIKDISDLHGDKSIGYNTFPIKYGIKNTNKLVLFLSFIVGLFAIIPYYNNYYSFWYIVIILIGVEIPLIVVVFLLYIKPGIPSAIFGAKILKFSTIMGLFAIYIGSLL